MAFEGFDNSGNGNGNTNLPSSRPTQSSFPPTDVSGRPTSSVFIAPSTSGTFSTDGSDGTSPGDYATTPLGGSSYPDSGSNSRPSSLPPDDLYNIRNKYPTTYPSNNRNPQSGNQPDVDIPTRPTDRPIIKNPQIPHQIEPDPPHVHHPYPIGPDPFPGYFPHVHPHYHFSLDHDYTDDKDSLFPGTYAHNAPSLHDRYYPAAPQSPHIDHYGSGGLYPSGRYPDMDHHLSGYGGNRKNGYQVTDNAPDVPMLKRKQKLFI